MPKVFKQADK